MFLSDQVSSHSNIKQFAEEYSSDMPPTFVMNGKSLNAELDLWSSIMSSLAKSYDNVQDTLKNTSEDLFPHLYQLLPHRYLFHTFICCPSGSFLLYGGLPAFHATFKASFKLLLLPHSSNYSREACSQTDKELPCEPPKSPLVMPLHFPSNDMLHQKSGLLLCQPSPSHVL